METILKVEGLCKNYPTFSLKNVSFVIRPGEIMGFIGRNGAGKTTTLKSIMNLIHYEKGVIEVFSKDMTQFELENKQRIGFSLCEINYYPNKTIKQLIDSIKRFFDNFDMNKFYKFCDMFNLDVNKKIEQLSSGMKVKYSLAAALSHDAELLILDEPTSGLDPVSRDEILDIFKEIVKNQQRAILFSTHITSDLDKCADAITYIHDGEILFTGEKENFINSYLYVIDSSNDKSLEKEYISFKEVNGHKEGLISKDKKDLFNRENIILKEPDLEQIMIFLERSN